MQVQGFSDYHHPRNEAFNCGGLPPDRLDPLHQATHFFIFYFPWSEEYDETRGHFGIYILYTRGGACGPISAAATTPISATHGVSDNVGLRCNRSSAPRDSIYRISEIDL